MRALASSFPVVLAGVAAAQSLSWQLPDQGGARYSRELKIEQQVEPKGVRVHQPWIGHRNPGLVVTGELDERRQRIAEPLMDPRDLLAWPCLDLSVERQKTVDWQVPGTNRFVDGWLEVSFGKMGEDGRQTVEGELRPGNGQRGRRGRRGRDNKSRSASNPDTPVLTGTMRGERVVDTELGRVVSFSGTIELVLEQEARGDRKAGRRRVTIQDSWTLQDVLDASEAEFRVSVGRAIREATESLRDKLKKRIEEDPPLSDDPFHDHNPGELALLLLAFIKGLEDPNDELVQEGYAALRKRKIFGTYELSVAILAIEALYTPPGEWRGLREGSLDAPIQRKLSAEDQALVTRWTGQLLENVDTNVDPAYLRRWHYGPSNSWDNSNQQYALLGLYAAQLCGVEISPQVWFAAAKHWQRVLIKDGEAERPQFVTHRQREQATERRGRGTVTRMRSTQPVGWSYKTGGKPTGSMTTAGVTGLTLCAVAMRQQKRGTRKQLFEIDQAIRGGLLWLSQNLTVRRNPGTPDKWYSWRYYYLYGLERTCELNGVAVLGARDWYFEGAMYLMGQQREDGTWGGDRETAFALLFLKKATLPAITPR